MAAIVDTTTLGKVILYSAVTGVGIVTVFGLAVSSAAALLEARRNRRIAASVAWGLLTTACLAISLAAVVLGVVVMASKS